MFTYPETSTRKMLRGDGAPATYRLLIFLRLELPREKGEDNTLPLKVRPPWRSCSHVDAPVVKTICLV